MAFMERETYTGDYWEIETDNGTWFLPDSVVPATHWIGFQAGWFTDETVTADSYDNAGEMLQEVFLQYTEGNQVQSVTRRNGSLYRLSAPGYLDCTDWTTDPDSPEFEEDEEEETLENHSHQWGPVEESRFTGNPHRKCQFPGCKAITDDLEGDDNE